jgi:hypothetical protein
MKNETPEAGGVTLTTRLVQPLVEKLDPLSRDAFDVRQLISFHRSRLSQPPDRFENALKIIFCHFDDDG